MNTTGPPEPAQKLPRGHMAITVVMKASLFAIFEIAGVILFARLLSPTGALASATLSVFLAATVANMLCMRIYEKSNLAEIGFGWNAAGQRNLLLGLAGGMGAAVLVLGIPLLVGAASWKPTSPPEAPWSTLLYVTILLLFGAAGEEMLFRGYGFQILVRWMGPWAAILSIAVLFAASHRDNPNVVQLGLFNTFGWGVIFGYAFWRSGDLWLPIGLHFGWNWVLPLFGVNLSGFTMDLTGRLIEWRIGALWSGGGYGPEGGLLTSAVVALVMVFLWKAPIRRQRALLLSDRDQP